MRMGVNTDDKVTITDSLNGEGPCQIVPSLRKMHSFKLQHALLHQPGQRHFYYNTTY